MTLSEAGKLADELFGRESIVIFDPGKLDEPLRANSPKRVYYIIGMDYKDYTLRIRSEISWEHAFEIAAKCF